MVVIIDYQAGNIGSIQNMLQRIGVESEITSHKDVISNASHLILPGVGAFDYGMQKLKELELVDLLKSKSLEQKVPTLGICLGAQLMCLGSEEGSLPGLGWIDAQVKRFPSIKNGSRYKVPHMGWDPVRPMKSSLLIDSLVEPRFYFVHSYFIDCNNAEDKLLQNEYSIVFDSAYEKGNIMGVQFHPEKSHRFGKQLLQNFIQYYQ